MRKALLASLLCGALTMSAQGVLSPKAHLKKARLEKQLSRTRTAGQEAQQTASFVITCEVDASPATVANALREQGAKIRALFGDQLTVEIPVSQLDAISQTEGIALIDITAKGHPKTDVTRQVTQADEAQAGLQLPQAYTGKGVSIAIIDAGYDVTHPMFKDADGNLRIKSLYFPDWDDLQGEKITTTVYDQRGKATEVELAGSVITDPDIILDTLLVKDDDGSHGTHVASIAAGSIMSDVKGISDHPLGGIAPEADILLTTSGNDFTHTLAYLDYYQKKSGQPLVTSISLNSQDGFHDGTSPAARILGNYCKQGHPLTLCASNEGSNAVYLTQKVKAGDTLRVALIPDYEDAVCYGYMKTRKKVKMQVGLFNIDYETGKYEVVYRLPYTFESDSKNSEDQGFEFELPLTEEQIEAYFPTVKDKNVYKQFVKWFNAGDFYNYIYQGSGLDANNERFAYTEIFSGIFSPEWTAVDEDYNGSLTGFCLYLIPEEDTEFVGWGDYSGSLAMLSEDNKLTPGTNEMSIGDWNTSGEPISIGAWSATNKVKYDGEKARENKNTVVGDYAYFSSFGTDRAGHKYPDACTPGIFINAAYNSFDAAGNSLYLAKKEYENQFKGQTSPFAYYYGQMSGTSMATPVAAGIVALWLQAAGDKGRTMTNADLKDVIVHSCDTDEFTDAAPQRFGNGKMNAYKGLLYILDLTGIEGLSTVQPAGITFRVIGDQVIADGAAEATPVSIYSLQGALVGQTSVQGGTISLAGLPQGVYALQLGKLGSTLVRK